MPEQSNIIAVCGTTCPRAQVEIVILLDEKGRTHQKTRAGNSIFSKLAAGEIFTCLNALPCITTPTAWRRTAFVFFLPLNGSLNRCVQGLDSSLARIFCKIYNKFPFLEQIFPNLTTNNEEERQDLWLRNDE